MIDGKLSRFWCKTSLTDSSLIFLSDSSMDWLSTVDEIAYAISGSKHQLKYAWSIFKCSFFNLLKWLEIPTRSKVEKFLKGGRFVFVMILTSIDFFFSFVDKRYQMWILFKDPITSHKQTIDFILTRGLNRNQIFREFNSWRDFTSVAVFSVRLFSFWRGGLSSWYAACWIEFQFSRHPVKSIKGSVDVISTSGGICLYTLCVTMEIHRRWLSYMLNVYIYIIIIHRC